LYKAAIRKKRFNKKDLKKG